MRALKFKSLKLKAPGFSKLFKLSAYWGAMFCLLFSMPALGFKMESRAINLPVTTGVATPYSFNFQQTYDVAPLVFVIATSQGAQPSAIRIRNVTVNGFEIAQYEPPNLDGAHAAMDVHYFAIEPGNHTLPDGTIIEVGSVSTTDVQRGPGVGGPQGWESINFSAGFASRPTLIAMIQTLANAASIRPDDPLSPWLTAAVRNTSNTGTELSLERSEVDSGSVSSNENIGYVAFQAGSGVSGSFVDVFSNTIGFDLINASNAVDGWNDGCDTTAFPSINSSNRLVLATKASRNDNNGGWLRRCSLNNTSVGLTVDEDQFFDSERNHGNEDVDIVVFSRDFVYDANFVPATADTTFKIEANEVTLTPGSFTTVNFQQSYLSPPAVFVLNDSGNPDPTAARIRNVTTTSFEVVAAEPPGIVKNPNQDTTIHYFAVDKGFFEFPDGTRFIVADENVSAIQQGNGVAGPESFQTVIFSNGFGAVPAVITQIQGMANEPAHTPGGDSIPWLTPTIQSNSVTTTSFNIALQRAEVNDGTVSVPEIVSYMAIEPGVINGITDNTGAAILAEAIRTADNITGFGTCNTNNFAQTYPNPPLVIGEVNSLDGGDGGWLRWCNITTTQVGLLVDEDQDQNTERNHTTERAGLMVFEGPFFVDFGRPVADWRFDESSWNGTANEVVDSSGNNYDGTANNVSTTGGLLCQAGDFRTSSNNDFLSLDNQAMNGLSDFTLVAWGRTSSLNGFQTIVSGANGSGIAANELIMLFDTANNFTPVISATFFNDTPDIAVSPAPNDDAWHQFVWVRTAASRESCFYLDGILQGCITNPATDDVDPLDISPGGLIIGQDQDSLGGGFDAGQDWEGLLDEMLVFDRVLPLTEIQQIRTNILAGNNWDGSTRTCPIVGPDSIDILVSGAAASTCVPKTITVRACADAACSSLFTGYTGTVSLTTSTSHGNWTTSGLNMAGLVPDPDNDDDGAVVYTFIASDAGSVDFQLSNFRAEDLTVTATDTVDNSLTDTSILLNFRDNTFVITDVDTLANDDLVVAGRNHSYQVQLFRRDTSQMPANCAVATNYNSNAQDLKAWFTTSGNVAGEASPQIGATVLPGSVPGADNITLDFSAGGVATFNLTTTDVGQYSLNIRDDSGSFSSLVIDGSSNQASVRPFGLAFSAIQNGALVNSGGDETGGGGFAAAEELFDVSIGAYLHQAADDTNDDGIPDLGADITNNGLTQSYQDDVDLSLAPGTTTPAAGVVGTLLGTVNISAASFANGEGTTQVAYSEVGSLQLDAEATDYLTITDATFDFQAQSQKIGRIYPDRFELVSSNVGAACGAFTYMSQPFSAYQYTLEALSVGGNRTQNYDDSTLLGYANTAAIDLYAENNDSGTDLGARLNENVSPTWTNGQYVLSSAGALFARGVSADGPYQSLQISIDIDTAAEADNRDLLSTSLNENPLTVGDCVLAANCTSIAIGAAQDLRYGRLVLFDAFGPEDQNLAIPLQTEYFDGANFVLNTADNCSTYVSSAVTILNTPPNVSPLGPVVPTTVVNGKSNPFSPLLIQPASPAATGEVDVSYDAPLWLEPDPTAKALFGRFRGNDRLIYWREVFN